MNSEMGYLAHIEEMQKRRGSFLAFNIDLDAYNELTTLVDTMFKPTVIDFIDLASIEAGRHGLDVPIGELYSYELGRGRTPTHSDLTKRPTIIVKDLFDPSQDFPRGKEYIRKFRRLLKNPNVNPGIRYILMELPTFRPNFSDVKGKDNLLYSAVTYVNMATGEFSKELR
jgi:hypothetical protein